MTNAVRFDPVEILLGVGPAAVTLKLKQLDGLHRLAFSCEAAELVDAIDRGEEAAYAFAFALSPNLPVSAEAAKRARRYQVELTLALEWAWLGVRLEDGELDPILWTSERRALARLVREGDPGLAVPPLTAALGKWFNGALVETYAEGEDYGASPNGAGAEAPTTAQAALH